MAALTENISLVNLPRRAPGVYFGDVIYAPGGKHGPRIQRDYQLVIVHLGTAEVDFNSKHCMIPPGSVALMLPGRREHFRFSLRHQTHHTWCAIAPEKVPHPLRRRLIGLAPVLPQSQTFKHLMKAAFSIRTRRTHEARHMLAVLGIALLEEYSRMANAAQDETNLGSPSERARTYIEEHCAEQDCLRSASRAAGVTPQHLIRSFREYYQQTPGRYMWQLRVERGAELLAATGLTVSEIAGQCGFNNPFHFSRLMRKMQGLSPRQLRERTRSPKDGPNFS